MEIKGKVHCFFEQSGTFKGEFRKMGYEAFDYDIQNDFGQTDYIIDLFGEIEKAYDNKPSVFDNIGKDDLIMAFFPCIYFETIQMTCFQLTWQNNAHKSYCDKIKDAIERLQLRTKYHTLLYKLVYDVMKRGLRLIIENPATKPSYLIGTQNFPNPTIIDEDRTRRGDNFKKPTAYWYFGCEPTYGHSYQKPVGGVRNILQSKPGKQAGICSEERSMISPDYARNFICDFILGKAQKGITELDLFDNGK